MILLFEKKKSQLFVQRGMYDTVLVHFELYGSMLATVAHAVP